MPIFYAAIIVAVLVRTIDDKGLGLGYVALMFIVVFFSTVVIHELGHLLAGWIVGFHFDSVHLGLFSLRLEYGRLKIGMRREIFASGYAAMYADGVRRLRRRLLAITAGGPVANLLSVPATVLLVNYIFPSLGNSWVSIPATQFAVLSLLLAFVGFVQIGSQGYIGDGGRISMLFTSHDRARRWMSIVAVGSLNKKGVCARRWNNNWLKAASGLHDNSRDEFAGNWIAYISANDKKDSSVAAEHLERCLELVEIVGPIWHDIAALEAAIFTAWFRKDLAIAEKWFEQVKKPKQIPQLLRIRADIALNCARCDFDAAVVRWQEGYRLIESLPITPSNNCLKESWLEWEAEIKERQSHAIAV